MNFIASLIAPVTTAISGAFKARQERKTAIAKVKSAVEIKKTDASYNLALSDKEWEALGKASEDGTWKDEAITLIILSPLVALILGALLSPDLTLFEAAQLSIREINSLDTSSGYGLLVWVVSLAGLGLKAWKR